MSEATKRTQNEAETKKEPFRIEIEQNEKFGNIMSEKYMTSNEFCTKVTELFRSVFADFEGSKYEINQQGIGTISLFFNHSEPKEKDRRNAITRNVPREDAKIMNDTVRRIRMQDNRNRNGDRYFLTEDGSDALSGLIAPQMVNRNNGEPYWNKIVAEVAQPSQYYGQPPIQYTKVSMVDPVKLAALIYGQTDDDGERLEYGVRIMSSMPQLVGGNNFSANYMLAITRVVEKEVVRLANMLGMSPSVGIDIIR